MAVERSFDAAPGTGPRLPTSYFDRLYQKNSDPWGFRDRWYEARKRDLTRACLLKPRYQKAFEPGCAIGVLTSELAVRCDDFVAMDPSHLALRQAQSVVPANVRLQMGAVPEDWPEGRFDLVVLSEVGYYLGLDECHRLASLAFGAADEVLAVHWRHPVADYPLSGDVVHDLLRAEARRRGFTQAVRHEEEDLRVEVWTRDGQSVARQTGIPIG